LFLKYKIQCWICTGYWTDRYTAEISHCEQFYDIGLAFSEDKHRQNLPFLTLWHLVLLHHRPMRSMHYLCVVICVQASITELVPRVSHVKKC